MYKLRLGRRQLNWKQWLNTPVVLQSISKNVYIWQQVVDRTALHLLVGLLSNSLVKAFASKILASLDSWDWFQQNPVSLSAGESMYRRWMD